MASDTDHRRALLTAALGFALLEWRDSEPPVVTALKQWLGCWNGVGHIATGMRRQGFDMHLWCDEGGWQATLRPVRTERP